MLKSRLTAWLSAGAIAAGFCLSPCAAFAEDSASLAAEVDLLRQQVDQLGRDMHSGLRLSGYFEMAYLADNSAEPNHFHQHHLALFLSRDWERWHFSSEVEYHGGTMLDGDGTQMTTTAGGIALERAWLEYVASDALTIRTGKMLLPLYWTINHYPNITLSASNPLMVNAVFPESVTGVMVHGTAFMGGTGSRYRLYTGNGQSANAAETDDNGNKAVGGGVTLTLGNIAGRIARFDVGANFYSERNPTDGNVDIIGAETQINIRGFELLAEYANRVSGIRKEGTYVQPSLLLFDEVRGFYRYDRLDTGTDTQPYRRSELAAATGYRLEDRRDHDQLPCAERTLRSGHVRFRDSLFLGMAEGNS